MIRYKDITGQKFNRWTVISFAYTNGFAHNQKHSKRAFWNCLCDCGIKRVVRAEMLESGKSKSCGCYRKEIIATKKGITKQPFFIMWRNIVRRCTNEKDKYYKNYGGRGIKLYNEWFDFNVFNNYVYTHLGNKPSKRHSLDRKNNEGNYEPGNIKWSTWEEQAKNRRIPKSLHNYSDEEIINELKQRSLQARTP